ncbi:Box C/D snoRNA protein 1 [Diplogelasinospora grovesii]|uniref:Box C/D snoRNA protein 1 n=1 Tax=Diplogelasinospora grovesii TaxID=303347 RepID=A0AAN6S5C7_9PEZI|nr:Box C/D snoRNA protein 1 [Diplogelasinospora grovesii]
MADPLLTNLCSICHAQPPKYTCPRCRARTCSVPCIQKHKARADCSGVRNPAAFVPTTQLKTPAGIDHDYNFITSIERARERAEREIIDSRRIVSEKELRPANEDKLFRKVWYGDELHHVPVDNTNPQSRGGPGGKEEKQSFDKHIRRRLRTLNIDAIMMPRGLARSRENSTAWNRRTLSVNWQVEWLVFSDGHGEQPTRVLRKTLEGKPLNEGLAGALEWHKSQQSRLEEGGEDEDMDGSGDELRAKKRRRHNNSKKKAQREREAGGPTGQDFETTWWSHPGAWTMQYSLTGAWSQTTTAAHIPKTIAEKEAEFERWQFFLEDGGIRTPKVKVLIPVEPKETLAEALQGRTVVEFPTIYAFPPTAGALPQGCIVGSTERRKRKLIEELSDDEEQANGRRPPPGKRRAFDGNSRGNQRGRGSRGRGRGRGGRDGWFPQRQSVIVGKVTEDDEEAAEAAEDGEIVDDDDDDGHDRQPLADVEEHQQQNGIEEETAAATRPSRGGVGLVDYGSDSE